MSNEPNHLPEITEEQRKVLEFFAEHAFPPIETTASGLVSVRMTSRFELTEVRIHREASHASGMEAIENAMREAVNAAIREVAERNAQRLDAYPGYQS